MLYGRTQWAEAVEKGVSLFYFYSSDRFLAQSAARKTVDRLAGGDGEVTELPGPAPTVEQLVMAAGSISFFSTRRVVYLPDLDPAAYPEADWKDFLDVAAGAENAVLVAFSTLKADKHGPRPGKQAKQLIALGEKIGYAAQLDHPTPQQMRSILRRKADSLDTVMSESAAAALLERCGPDMFLLENEVEKLAAASGYTEITPALAAEMGVRNLELEVFAITGSVTAHHAARACAQLDALLRLGYDPVQIAATLAGSFVDMYRVRVGRESGKDHEQVFKDFGYTGNPKRLFYSGKDAGRYAPAQLERCLEILDRLDGSLKGDSPVDNTVQLQMALCELAAVGAGGRR